MVSTICISVQVNTTYGSRQSIVLRQHENPQCSQFGNNATACCLLSLPEGFKLDRQGFNGELEATGSMQGSCCQNVVVETMFKRVIDK